MAIDYTLSVEVAWTQELSGVFRIGTSTIDGSDVIAGTFGGNVFDTIPTSSAGGDAWVMRVEISRGRNSESLFMEHGRCRIVLADPDGIYNHLNPASSLAGYLVPMRPVRVRATYDGTTYGRFYGYISRIEHDPVARESYLECVDLFEWLATQTPTIASTGATTVGAAIGLVLDAVEFTDPALRSLDTGRAIADFSAGGTLSALALIGSLIAYDRGACFVAGDGIFTFQAGETRYQRTASAATFTGSLISQVKTAIDVNQIVNRQKVTKTGGAEQEAEDDDSRRDYSYRDGGAITSAYFASDAEALSLAKWLVILQANGRPPVRGVALINSSADKITQQFTRGIGDVVTVTEDRGGTDYLGTIEAIQETHRPGSILRSTFLIPERTVQAFVIGLSTIGSTDRIYW